MSADARTARAVAAKPGLPGVFRALRFVAIGFCLALAGCGSGKIYSEPLSTMHHQLAEVDELPPVFGSAAPGLSMDTSDPSAVTWIVEVDGSEVMRFIARLQPEGAQSTRMVLDLVGATSSARGDVQKRLSEHPEVKRLYLVAMTEQIESKLEKRPFDATRLYGALAAAAAANIGTISRQADGNAQSAEQAGEN